MYSVLRDRRKMRKLYEKFKHLCCLACLFGKTYLKWSGQFTQNKILISEKI